MAKVLITTKVDGNIQFSTQEEIDALVAAGKEPLFHAKVGTNIGWHTQAELNDLEAREVEYTIEAQGYQNDTKWYSVDELEKLEEILEDEEDSKKKLITEEVQEQLESADPNVVIEDTSEDLLLAGSASDPLSLTKPASIKGASVKLKDVEVSEPNTTLILEAI